MNIEQFRELCLTMEGAVETTPFGPDHIVYKVGIGKRPPKMFALSSLDTPNYVQFKCDPDIALLLRDRYPNAVEAGWHMNKAHWNGVTLDALPASIIEAMLLHSYTLVAYPLVGDRARRIQSLEHLAKTAQI